MIALDTNVLIYACDKNDKRRQQVALQLIATSNDGVLLWQVACEFVAATRKLSSQGFTENDAWARLADYIAIFPMITPTPGILDRARVFHTNDGCSFWDTMILAACLECGVTRLYSEDLPGQIFHGLLEVVNPF